MRLSTVFELLLIFLLIAFAAYGRVIDRDEATSLRRVARAAEGRVKQGNLGVSIMSLKQATENLNNYCKCDNDVCQCCRDFHIPVVALKGPGCASIRYFEKDNLEFQLSFGDNLLSSTVVNGKKSRTICVPMPGGFSKFCGRIYSIQRTSDSNFKACLGLELQSSYEVEASLRVSCFSFGPEGVKLRPAEAFPPTAFSETENENDDDDDDDITEYFELEDDTDNKKDINQLPSKNTAVAGAIQPADEEEEEDDDDDDDYSLGLDAFLDIITGDDETEKKKPAAVAPPPLTVLPLINKPTRRPIVAHPTTKAPKVQAETSTTEAPIVEIVGPFGFNAESSTEVSLKNGTEVAEEETTEAITESSVALEVESSTDVSEMSDSNKTEAVLEAAASDDNKQVVKVEKVPVIKKIIVGVTDKKSSITSNSVNAIKNDVKKPLAKPAKPDLSADSHNTHDSENDDDAEDIEDDDEDDEDLLSEAISDDDDEEEETETNEDEEDDNDKLEAYSSTEGDIKRPTDDDHEEVSDEDLLDDDDDDDDDNDDEEEASLMSEIIGDDDDDEDDKKKKKKNKNLSTTEASKKDEYSISDILNRKITRRGRQSKVMRL
ncbi:GSCOCG00000022001-RA-CDS [Cotesia congregata]|nr:GSCOCG00000022001-RA-CDS [Cotesia congregata]